MSTVFNDQHAGFGDNIGTTLDSIKLNRDSLIDEEGANNKYVDNELYKKTILKFNQTLQNYLMLSVGTIDYFLTKHNK